ncbi:MAG TPA: hypothetical protein VEO54_23145 [Thermoanaerobaculia bacterium]|nr:hypothetical protein [Thermoanaerobaculia bacterium]
MKRAAIGLVLAMVCVPLVAQKPYEAVIAGIHGGCAFEPFQPTVDWIGPSGSIAESEGHTVAAAPSGRVFAADRSDDVASAFEVNEIGLGGFSRRVSQTIPGSGEPAALVVDASGNMYVLASNTIYALTAAGALRATYPLGAFSATAMDLAADQCTMLFAAGTTVRRFNVCTGTPLPDFGPVAHEYFGLRILPDGGVLLSRDNAIDRYTAGGVLARTYAVTGLPIAMGLANGGDSVWLARFCVFDLIEMDLGTGAVRTIATIGSANPNSIVPYLGWSAVLGSFHNAGIPTASQLMLVALGFLLASFAIFRMR